MEQARDSRFFPGYTWVSQDPNCKTGLCMPTTDPEEAARLYLARRLEYHNVGRVFVVYTMSQAGDEPLRIEVTV